MSLDIVEAMLGRDETRAGKSAPDENAIAREIGKALRSLRKQRGFSLNDLAGLSGVSRSMLSQMETGRSVPSIVVMCKIAQSLNVPVTAFLQSDEPEGPRYLSAEETPLRISADGKCAWRLLMPQIQEQKTEFFELTLRGGGIEKVAPYPKGVKANLAVSNGYLFVAFGRQRHRLGAGDVLEFSASIPHSYVNPGNAEAMAYLVLRHPPRAPLI